jgi:hypothetical protein
MAAARGRTGFEGAVVLEALLAEAGRPRSIAEVDSILRAGLEEGLLPSELVSRVLGTRDRELEPGLARRVAENLFALHESIGKERLFEAKRLLTARAARLMASAVEARLAVERRAAGEALKNAVACLVEAEEALRDLTRDLEERPPTRRLCASADGSLAYLAALIGGAVQVIADALRKHEEG